VKARTSKDKDEIQGSFASLNGLREGKNKQRQRRNTGVLRFAQRIA
jgi:hypothetical protein